jgi:hypothetical protein
MSKNKVTRKTKVVCKPRKSNATARRPSTMTPPLRQRSDGGPPARWPLPQRPPARQRCHHDPCNDDPPAMMMWPGTAMTRVRHVFGALELTGFFFVGRLSLQHLVTSPAPSTQATGGGPQSGWVLPWFATWHIASTVRGCGASAALNSGPGCSR